MRRTSASRTLTIKIVCLLAVVGCGAETSKGGDQAQPDPELESIKTFVLDCQRAGYVRNDFKVYDRQWADGAKLICGRGPTAGKHETTLNREQIRETRQLRMAVPPREGLELEFRDVEIVRDGPHVRLTCTTAIQFGGLEEVVGEQYLLARTDEGWRVIENRFWPIQWADVPPTRFTPEFWLQLDDAIDSAPRGEELELGLFYLAHRYGAGFQLALRRTLRPSATVADWLYRAEFAYRLGLCDDALESWRSARKLDPEAAIPDFAVHAIKSSETDLRPPDDANPR